jgi:murein DD-endopeptidase MepM/ murein hydrolase activator NlpD
VIARRIFSGLLALPLVFIGARGAAADFSFNPPGKLVAGSGTGRVDTKVYAPGMRFPIEKAPAYANSQVWGVGGSAGPAGSQCDIENFSYPWSDNYCETRSWSMPLCPSGTGHQGQDVRAASCDKNVHSCVATVDGKITSIGTYSVYLTGNDGTIYRYLHMGNVAVTTGMAVTKGELMGKVSNEFGGTPTSVHLHFDLKQNVAGLGSVFVPPYMSLVKAYEALVGPTVPALDAKFIGQGSDAQADPDGLGFYRVCAGQKVHFWFELENTGSAAWTDVSGSVFGQSVRLGVPGDGIDPFTGTSRISLNENLNTDVHSVNASSPGADCNDKSGCRRTVFTKGYGIEGTAPSSLGVHETRWQLVDETRAWFGPEMYLSFNVVDCQEDAGNVGVGGGSGSGGSAANTGSSPGVGGGTQKTTLVGDDDVEGGCACRQDTRSDNDDTPSALAALALGVAAAAARRRRR